MTSDVYNYVAEMNTIYIVIQLANYKYKIHIASYVIIACLCYKPSKQIKLAGMIVNNVVLFAAYSI